MPREEEKALRPPRTADGIGDADPDATRIIRPRPGGRRPETPAAPPPPVAPVGVAPVAPSPVVAQVESPLPPTGLLAHADAPLQLLARLSTLAAVDDPAALRDAAAAAIRAFAERAEAAGVAPDLVRRGHYALCDSIDAAALNTPWGPGSDWARRTLVATFHPQIGQGRFADALRAAEARPAELAPVLELMMLCLSLGVPDEPARARAAAAALAGAPPPPPLAPNWQGIDAPFRPSPPPKLPVWVAAAVALAVGAGAYLYLRAQVDGRGDALFTAMVDAPPAQMPQIAREPAPPLPPPPPPPEPTVRDRLAARLGDTSGVTVAGSPGSPVLRLADKDLFAREGASLLPAAGSLIARVAAALGGEAGAVAVIGYGDDRPVRTVAFPSAFKLSAARAESVRAALAKAVPTLRFAAEGRGAADPVASNGTEAGREANRRVDVVLTAASP